MEEGDKVPERPEEKRSDIDEVPECPEDDCCELEESPENESCGLEERPQVERSMIDDPPERPEDSDCCGQGCDPCVFDIYAARLAAWERSRLSATSDRVTKPAYLSETRYRSFVVTSVESHTASARLITFRAPGAASLGLKASQHLVMRGGDKLSRAYTPVSLREGEFDLLVRIYPDGRMSSILSALGPGDQAQFRGPYGGPGPYRRNRYRRVLMLCAGTGLAPMVSTATSVVADESDETFVRLLYCERSASDVLLRDRLRTLAQAWNFTARIHLPPGDVGTPRYGEELSYARLDREALAGELGADVARTLVMICGSEAFNADMKEHALALGVEPSNIHVF